MASSSYANSCVLPQMSPPKYEENTITQYRVMAHFSCIHYVPCDLDLWTIFSKIESRDLDVVRIYVPIL